METAQMFHRCLRQTLLRSPHCKNATATPRFVQSLSKTHASQTPSPTTRQFSTSFRCPEQLAPRSQSQPKPRLVQTGQTTPHTPTDPTASTPRVPEESPRVDNIFTHNPKKGVIDAASIEADIAASSSLVSNVLVFGGEKHFPGALLFRSKEAKDMSNDDFLDALAINTETHGIARDMLIPMTYLSESEVLEKNDDSAVRRARRESRYQKEIDEAYVRLLGRPRPELMKSYPARNPAFKTILEGGLPEYPSRAPNGEKSGKSLTDQLDIFAGDMAGFIPGKSRSDGAYGAIDSFRRKSSQRNTFDQDELMRSIMAEPTNIPPPRALRLKPVLGRTIRVAPERYVDVTRAFRLLESKCTQNNVKHDAREQKTYVRRGQRKKIERMKRWRALFQVGFMEECGRVRRMRAQGW